MKIAFITGGIPNPYTSGGAQTAHGMIESLRLHGHEVRVLALLGEHEVSAKVDKGDIDWLPVLRYRTLNPVKHFLPSAHCRRHVKDWLDWERPDLIVGYHWDALAALPRVKIPVVCGLGDPMKPRWLMRWLLRKVDRAGMFAAHHALEFELEYWRTPI